jgi:hypothetical protein
MNQEIKALWVEALRSGEYRQGQEYLGYKNHRGEMEYCCLGVLCEIATEKGVTNREKRFDGNHYGLLLAGEKGSVAMLPEEVAQWAGITNAAGDADIEGFLPEFLGGNPTLWRLNDSGHYDFNAIADIIEEKF